MHFSIAQLTFPDKTIKLWKISERNLRIDGPLNTKSSDGTQELTPSEIRHLKIPELHPTPLMVEASPRKIFANAHTYHVNSISVNSDDETYLSADDLRINLWNLQRTDQSFSIFSLLLWRIETKSFALTIGPHWSFYCNHLLSWNLRTSKF